MAQMSGRVCLITGATGGIGLATAEALARMDAELIVHGRDAARVDAAVQGLRQRTGNQSVGGILADLTSLDAVREMAKQVKESGRPLHVLVCNAGVFSRQRRKTKDGFELMFGVNHLAHFLLTCLLVDRLNESAPGRIVIVASGAHRGNPIDLNDLNGEKSAGGFSAYGRSKFANILFAKELARRLKGTQVVANALHPGFVATNMTSSPRPPLSWITAAIKPLILSPQEGAKTSVYLASSPQAATVSGQYLVKCREAVPDPATADEDLARGLWEQSAALVGLA